VFSNFPAIYVSSFPIRRKTIFPKRKRRQTTVELFNAIFIIIIIIIIATNAVAAIRPAFSPSFSSRRPFRDKGVMRRTMFFFDRKYFG